MRTYALGKRWSAASKKGGAVRFHSLHLPSRSRRDAARNRERLEIAFMFATLAAIIVILIGGSRLLVEMLQS